MKCTMDEEQIFDFMAAAEDTGKRLDEMVKRLPGELRAVLTEEWRRSPWLAMLPATADRVTAAAERAESAVAALTEKVKFAGSLVCLAAVVLPLATWGYVHWQTSKLREDQAANKAETEWLRKAAAALEDGTGGGVAIWKQENGRYTVALPNGVEPDWNGKYEDGRSGFTHAWPPPASQ